jgi:signal transduction histidine kinase
VTNRLPPPAASVLGGRDRRRAFLWSLPVLTVAAAVDVGTAGLGARSLVWAGWIAAYLALALLTDRISHPADVAFGVLGGMVATTALLALAVTSGGSRSIYFVVLPMLPLLSGLVAPGNLVDPAIQGGGAVVGGAVVLAHDGAPAGQVVGWIAVVSLAVGFALAANGVLRRRQAAFLQLESDRAEALARLAEAERARTDAERWAAAGQVADQVAHDVNSPLGALRSSLHFAREEVGAGRTAEALEAIEDCAACVERIHGIVSDLSHRIGRAPAAEER